MNRQTCLLPLLVLPLLAGGVCRGADVFGPQPTWDITPGEELRRQVLQWADKHAGDAELKAKIEQQWVSDGSLPEDRLQHLMETFATADGDCRALLATCQQSAPARKAAELTWLSDPAKPAFVRNNARLFYARWLARHRLYDEALSHVEGLQPDDVIDPSTLLFYQALAYHQLVQREAAIGAAQRLLERGDELPRRYRHLARLVVDDVRDLEVDSLDHIARRMGDIERRLSLGRAGKRVRNLEDGVIESLDKLIEDLEEQQQQQQASASQSAQPSPSKPQDESRPAGLKGEGKVAKKDIGSKQGWGDLPPKQREEALQQIGKQFPSHFRDVIEQYFRKIAGDASE